MECHKAFERCSVVSSLNQLGRRRLLRENRNLRMVPHGNQVPRNGADSRKKTTLEHEVRMDSPSSIGGGFKHFLEFLPRSLGK